MTGFLRFLVPVTMLWFVAGCVAVDVGRPELLHHDVKREVIDAKPRRVALEKARVQLWQRGETAIVSLDAEVLEEYARQQYAKRISVRRQKRLAFGLFPGAAELVWMPKGALASAMTVKRAAYESLPHYCGFYDDHDPDLLHYTVEQLKMLGMGLLVLELGSIICTVESMLLAPFETWECGGHDFIDREYWKRGVLHNGQRVADASRSPRLQALAELPEELRRRIGVRTCFDVQSMEGGEEMHFGLFGFHKYLAVSVDIDETGGDVTTGIQFKKKKTVVSGPFEVEFSIPGIGYSERHVVGQEETQTTFALPSSVQDTTIKAYVSVRECVGNEEGKLSSLTEQAIRNLTGQNSRFDVNLRGSRAAPITHARTYEIEQILPERDGKYLVRVRIADSRQTSTIANDIAPDVRRLIREAYIRRHPATRVEEICDCVEWRVDADEPAILVFEGWAFAARPLASGWKWNAGTRRGRFRIAFSAGVPEEQIRKWTRENIAAIVADKNIVLAPGERPSGARYRIVSESFENGVFSVEFEALE